MTTLFHVGYELVIGLHRTIIFVNTNDLQVFKEIELPATLLAGKAESEREKETEDDEEKNVSATKEPLKIQQVSYAPDRQLLAVTTSGEKCLLLYRCRPEHAWLVSTRALSRASSALTFSSDSKSVLVTDKTGDCYLYDCENMESPPKLLLGHLSIVNDVLWTDDQKYIITCDRDDKIRITNYPGTCEIHGYCLGHKEFVSSLRFFDKNTIASISGDKTLRIWNYESCKELLKVELPGPATRFDIREYEDGYLVAILHPLDDCVSEYYLEKVENGNWKSGKLSAYQIKDFNACNLCFAGSSLFVTGVANEKLVLKMLTEYSPVPEKWFEMVESRFEQYSWTPEDITTWFKKRYDNVSEYLERKKRRIEEKQK